MARFLRRVHAVFSKRAAETMVGKMLEELAMAQYSKSVDQLTWNELWTLTQSLKDQAGTAESGEGMTTYVISRLISLGRGEREKLRMLREQLEKATKATDIRDIAQAIESLENRMDKDKERKEKRRKDKEEKAKNAPPKPPAEPKPAEEKPAEPKPAEKPIEVKSSFFLRRASEGIPCKCGHGAALHNYESGGPGACLEKGCDCSGYVRAKEAARRVDPAKQLDKDIEQSYYRQCKGTQIDIMDIGKLFNDVRVAVQAGGDLDEAVRVAIEKYKAGESTWPKQEEPGPSTAGPSEQLARPEDSSAVVAVKLASDAWGRLLELAEKDHDLDSASYAMAEVLNGGFEQLINNFEDETPHHLKAWIRVLSGLGTPEAQSVQQAVEQVYRLGRENGWSMESKGGWGGESEYKEDFAAELNKLDDVYYAVSDAITTQIVGSYQGEPA